MKSKPDQILPGKSSIRHLLPGISLLATLSGCAALLPGGGTPALDTYELAAPAPEAEAPRRSRIQILVAEPTALKILDAQNIVVKARPGSIEYLKGAQWADRLPRVVQAKLAETFQESGRFGGVGLPGQGLAIDYQIVTEVRAFEIRVGGGESAHVELFVKVLNDRNGMVRASRAFTASAAVTNGDNAALVAALDRAFGAAAAEIVSWAASVM